MGERSCDTGGEIVSEVNKVSVAFPTDENVQLSKTLLSLFDTGSPINLIQTSAVPSRFISTDKMYSGYNGVGGFPLCTYGIVPVNITFRNRTQMLKLYAVPDHFTRFFDEFRNHPL